MAESLSRKRYPSLEITAPMVFAGKPVHEHTLKVAYEPSENPHASNIVLSFGERPVSERPIRQIKWTSDRESLAAALTSNPGIVVPDRLDNIHYTRVMIPDASIADEQGFGVALLRTIRAAVRGPQAEPSKEYVRLDCYGKDVPVGADQPSFSTLIPFDKLYSFVYGTLLDAQPDAVREPHSAAFYYDAFVSTIQNPKDPFLS